LLAALAILVVLSAAPAEPWWRLHAVPRDAAEVALRTALANATPAARADALALVASEYPGTSTAGLAHLAAGLALLDAKRHADALAHLGEPEVQQTLLRDQALIASARAQEGLARMEDAARSYLAAAEVPDGAVACTALPAAAAALRRAGRTGEAVRPLEQTVASCPAEAPPALLALGEAYISRGDRAAAAAALDRLDREFPASEEARKAAPSLRTLAPHLPTATAAERASRALDKGLALLGMGRSVEAIAVLRGLKLEALPPDQADLARVRLGRALLARWRPSEARAVLGRVPRDSPYAAEAAYQLARDRARRAGQPDAYETVVDRFPGTPWSEEALLALANHYQKDSLDGPALRWWRRLLEEHPDGRYVERAAWRVGWADFRAGRYETAAYTLEGTARLRPPSAATAGFLYWSARARLELGQTDRAYHLLRETVLRYKHAYHGLRARDELVRRGAAPAPAAVTLTGAEAAREPELPEPAAARLRDLLLIDRLEEAAEEVRRLPDSARVRATLAWIDWRRGRFRPAIIAMKQAFPEWVGEAGDRLPDEVWRILFPLRFEEELRARAEKERLDASLIAALILQESSFDPAALSGAGARGLMQVIPATGRRVARELGVRYRRAALYDPETSLDFGTRYLRQMSDRYEGGVERVLAAYNAGPHRVDAWTALEPALSGEVFIESIPFSETRGYVMIVLSSREQYRRLYGLGRSAPGPVTEGARP